MAYKGKWKPKNYSKYSGNSKNITYRSLWERQAFKWCDENPNIVKWSSEEVVVPYRSKTDGKAHKYYPDLKILERKNCPHRNQTKETNKTPKGEIQKNK